jgi:NAD(P)-dependent dehydrogenase (short-subunit alcohol dehydrogenase family)
VTQRVLSGHTAIVTGAGHGIGTAVSCALGRAGATVVLACDGRDLDALAEEIRVAGGHAVSVPTDLNNPVSVRRLVEQTLGAFGRLDAAVNNAGAALAMAYELPPMRRAGRGCVVNLAPSADIVALSHTAAGDLANTGVRIHAVCLGPTEDVAEAVVGLCSGVTQRSAPNRAARG